MEILVLILFFGGLIGGLVLLIRYVKRTAQKKVEWYKTWGLKLNLEHSMKKYLLAKLNTLAGELDGQPVIIYEKIVGSGKHQQLYTNITFQPNPFDFEFRIAKEGFFSKATKAFGAKDIEFGDDVFDKTFLLKSEDESKFRSLMDFRAQGALQAVEKNIAGSIMSTKTDFTYSYLGGFTKEAKVAELELILDFMRLLIKNKR